MTLTEVKEYLQKNITIPKFNVFSDPLKNELYKKWAKTTKNTSDFNAFIKFYYNGVWAPICHYYRGPNTVNKQIYLDHDLNLISEGNKSVVAVPISTKFTYYGNDLMILFFTSAPFKGIHTNLLCCIIYEAKEYFFDLCTIKKSNENQQINFSLGTSSDPKELLSIFVSERNFIKILPHFPGNFIVNQSAIINEKSSEIRIDIYQILKHFVKNQFHPIQIQYTNRAHYTDVDILFNN